MFRLEEGFEADGLVRQVTRPPLTPMTCPVM